MIKKTVTYLVFFLILISGIQDVSGAEEAAEYPGCHSIFEEEPKQAAEEIATPSIPNTDQQEKEEPGFLDLAHGLISETMSAPAVWFDGFFGEKTAIDDAYAGVFVRWRNAIQWNERDVFVFNSQFNASIRLPKLTKKLRFFVMGEREDELTTTQPVKAIDPALAAAPTQTPTDAGLRYDVIDTIKSKFDLRAGMRLREFQPFIRARYHYERSLGGGVILRFIETAYYWRDDGFAETSRLDLEKSLDPNTLLRLSNSVSYIENTPGVAWVPNIILYHQLSPRDAVSLDVSALYITRPDGDWMNFRIGTKYRRNFYRPWLFFEIEPEISWPRNEYHDTTSIRAVTFVLEIQFSGS